MEYIYTLKDGFEYAGKGEVINAEFITLEPPTARYITDIAPVKSYVMRAMVWSQNQAGVEGAEVVEIDDASEESNISPGGMMGILELAPDVEMDKLLLHINAMFTNGLAKVDGEVKFTKPLSDKLSISDVYGLAGYFLVNFILPSIL